MYKTVSTSVDMHRRLSNTRDLLNISVVRFPRKAAVIFTTDSHNISWLYYLKGQYVEFDNEFCAG